MAQITLFLQKAFASLGSRVIPLGMIAFELLKCAKAHSYVETLGSHSDSLHRWIKQSYLDDFQRSFEMVVRKNLMLLGVSRARLSVDVTPEPFYGKSSSPFLFGVKGERWNSEFHYIVISLITRNKSLPLMALPVVVGEGVAKPTVELIKYAQSVFKNISLITFDRGFYSAELIDYLEAHKLRYIIFIPQKRGRIKEYVEQTTTLGKYHHTMKYAKEKSLWKPKTTIVVCKGIDEFPWLFATNINFKTRSEYIYYYKRRWQIETNFRVSDEANIKSKSTNHLIRYFYFLISILLQGLWIVNKNIKEYLPFKKYLDQTEQQLLHKFLEIKSI